MLSLTLLIRQYPDLFSAHSCETAFEVQSDGEQGRGTQQDQDQEEGWQGGWHDRIYRDVQSNLLSFVEP